MHASFADDSRNAGRALISGINAIHGRLSISALRGVFRTFLRFSDTKEFTSRHARAVFPQMRKYIIYK